MDQGHNVTRGRNRVAVKGNELYQLFVELTGLSSGTVEDELQAHMKRLDMDPENLNTDDIRKLMTLYLDEFNMGISNTNDSDLKELSELNEISELNDPVDSFSLFMSSIKAEA